jgi:hypothetical protein
MENVLLVMLHSMKGEATAQDFSLHVVALTFNQFLYM